MVIWNGGQESERKQTWRCGQPVGWVLVDWSVFIEFRSTLPCGVGSETTAGAKFIARYSFAAARIPSRGEIKWFRGGIVVKKKNACVFLTGVYASDSLSQQAVRYHSQHVLHLTRRVAAGPSARQSRHSMRRPEKKIFEIFHDPAGIRGSIIQRLTFRSWWRRASPRPLSSPNVTSFVIEFHVRAHTNDPIYRQRTRLVCNFRLPTEQSQSNTFNYFWMNNYISALNIRANWR